MARIFISYSRADKQFIDQFIPLIRRVYGHGNLWFDEDIHGGTHWWQLILKQVGTCELFVYLVSNESLESRYCQAELEEALRLKKQILPVVVRRLNPPYPGNIPDHLADILHKIQYVDMAKGFSDPNVHAMLYGSINRLLDAVPERQQIPIHSTSTPEPPVIDKKSWRDKVKQAQNVMIVVLITTILGVFVTLMTLRFDILSGDNVLPTLAQISTTVGETSVADMDNVVNEPSQAPTNLPTLTVTSSPLPTFTPTNAITNTPSPIILTSQPMPENIQTATVEALISEGIAIMNSQTTILGQPNITNTISMNSTITGTTTYTKNDAYLFYGNANDKVIITLSSSTLGSSTYLTLKKINMDNSVTTLDTNMPFVIFGSIPDIITPYTFDEDGIYVISVYGQTTATSDPFKNPGDFSGDYTLSLQRIDN